MIKETIEQKIYTLQVEKQKEEGVVAFKRCVCWFCALGFSVLMLSGFEDDIPSGMAKALTTIGLALALTSLAFIPKINKNERIRKALIDEEIRHLRFMLENPVVTQHEEVKKESKCPEEVRKKISESVKKSWEKRKVSKKASKKNK